MGLLTPSDSRTEFGSPQQRLDALQNEHARIEAEMIDLALEHNLELYTDAGRLLLEDDKWTGKSRGEWYTSTDSCS